MVGRAWKSRVETRLSLLEFVGEMVDLWMTSVFSFSLLDGEAWVKKTAVLIIVPSVKDP